MSAEVKFAVLMTHGSPGPIRILGELARHGFAPHTAYILKPDWKANLRRVRRKLLTAGLLQTIGRIGQIWRKDGAKGADASSSIDIDPLSGVRVIQVGRFDSEAMLDDARGEGFDVFLAMTDEILRRKTFSIPRMGTLNAHPARNPEYRGLSALERMLRDGEPPEITLHLIDEGIDTGPILKGFPVTSRIVADGHIDDEQVSLFQARAFIYGLQMASRGSWTFEDRFARPSNMSRALSAKQIRDLLLTYEDSVKHPPYFANRHHDTPDLR